MAYRAAMLVWYACWPAAGFAAFTLGWSRFALLAIFAGLLVVGQGIQATRPGIEQPKRKPLRSFLLLCLVVGTAYVVSEVVARLR